MPVLHKLGVPNKKAPECIRMLYGKNVLGLLLSQLKEYNHMQIIHPPTFIIQDKSCI